MKIGDLRQRVTFQEKRKVADGYKGSTVTWLFVCEVWASVEPLSGREYFFSHQTKAEISHRVKIRYRTGLTESMRIKYGDRALEIESILDIKERHEVLEILCREVKE